MKNILDTLNKNSWLHLYQMLNISNAKYYPFVLVEGKGIYVYDVEGKRYIDGISGAYCINVGYGRKSVLEEAFKAAEKIHYVSPFSYGNQPAIMLATKLSELAAPLVGDKARVFFVNSGAEAVETAVKAAIAYARRTTKPEAYKIICRNKAYHGTTFGAMTFCGFDFLKQDYGPGLPGVYHAPDTNCTRCPLNLKRDSCDIACASAIEKIIIEQNPNTVAAVLIEPFETSSGIVPPPIGYLEKVQQICKNTNTVLILDEVLTGFGRLGYWFGAQKYNMQCDVLVTSKGLTSGYDSLGAAIIREEIGNVFLGNDQNIFAHASTFGGRPGAAAAALQVIKIIEEENLLQNVEIAANFLSHSLKNLSEQLPIIGQIRHGGLLFGIDLVDSNNKLLSDISLIRKIRHNLLNNGLITSLYYANDEPIIELAPPINISINECEEIIRIIRTSLEDIILN